jgi:hypothetical protein
LIIGLILFIFGFYFGCPVFAVEPTGYFPVTGPCFLEFPEDHGAHPGYRTEWWYYTGNLRSETGDFYGFLLTFFADRSVLRVPTKPGPTRRPPGAPSRFIRPTLPFQMLPGSGICRPNWFPGRH